MKSSTFRLTVILLLTVLLLEGIPIIPLRSPGRESINAYRVSSSADFSLQSYVKVMNATAFVSPDGSKDALWYFLNAARESIYVEIYGINNPYILDLIHTLHDTKPSLDMRFLLGWNSLGYYSPNDYVANNLTELGYPVRWTSDTEFRFAHQKFVIIDNQTTIVHSGNWAKTSFPEEGKKANREWSIAINDTDVCSYYRSVFDYDWGNGIEYDPAVHGTGSPLSYSETGSTYPRPYAESESFYEMMNVTPVISPDTSLEAILYCINSARYTLDIQVPYFTSIGDNGAVDEVVDAILAARARGVTVRVISEEEKDWETVAQTFYDHDIPITWQDTRWFSAQHNKGIIVDGRIVLISSINYSDDSITENREAGVIIENHNIAQWFLDIFDYDWEIADASVHMGEVNLYWTPNIPNASDPVTVSVFAHRHYGSVTKVNLSVRINDEPAVNYTITSNVYPSREGDLENYYHEISPRPHGTNMTVRGFIQAGGIWYNGTPMVIFVLDTLAETAIDSPPDMEFEEGSAGLSITWRGSSSEPDSFVVYRNGSIVDSGDWDGSPILVPLDGLSSGHHNYTCLVNDTSGNTAIDTVWVNVLPEEPPSIDGPADVNYELGTQSHNITWSFSDTSPDTYVLYRNGTVIEEDSYQTSDYLTVDVGGLVLGVHNYTLWLNDTLGNHNHDEVIITVTDTVAPSLSSPPDISFERGNTGYDIRWTGISTNPDAYTVYRNGTVIDSASWNGSMILVDLVGLHAGYHNYTCSVNETSGLSARDTVWVTVHVAAVPTIDGPADITYEYGTTEYTLAWALSDMSPDTYLVYLDGEVILSDSYGSSDLVTLHVGGLELGEYNYTLWANDTIGNEAWDSVMVLVEDTTAPTVSSPEDFEHVIDESVPVIIWQVSDDNPSNYSIYVDDVLVRQATWGPEDMITFSFDESRPGTYEVRIVVRDMSGNSAEDVVIVTIRQSRITDHPMFYPAIGLVSIILVCLVVLLLKKR